MTGIRFRAKDQNTMFKTEHPARHYFVSSRITMRSPVRADFETLLHPVLRGMRQRTFVILDP